MEITELEKSLEKTLQTEKYLLGQLAGNFFDRSGFSAFYTLCHGNKLPAHTLEWIDEIFAAKEDGKGNLIFSWRGSWKTTTISITFIAFFIGHHPDRANLIIQANDQSANDTTQKIASLIEHSSAWQYSFPDVKPDYEFGWGAGGYEVKRTDMSYSEWRDMNTTRRDPTLLGLGIRSRSLIGKHPNGILLLDDIHDEENSASVRERENVINKLTGTILPFIVEGQTWLITVGTPWTDDDAYHYLKRTGELRFFQSSVMVESDEGVGVRISEGDMTSGEHNDIYGWWELKWPEMFNKKLIVAWRNRTGKREFWRMYMLNLKMAKETGLKYVLFPHDKIDVRWPCGAGVDYASTIEIRGKRIDPEKRSKFALAYGLKTPFGKAVIYDGIIGHFTQLQCENYVERAQGLFENFDQTGVEMDGKGEELYALLSRKPYLQLFPFWVERISKPNRHERYLSPYLEAGLLMVSDADTDFLNSLRKALDEWPHGNLDIIDAVYAYAKTIPDILNVGIDMGTNMRQDEEELEERNPFQNTRRTQ